MNYGQLRDHVLKLINQYSIAGNKIASSYNNQQDYLNRIPAFANDAMMEIATTVRKIPTIVKVADLPCEDLGEDIRFTMPADFYQLKSGDTIRLQDGHVIPEGGFMQVASRYVIVKKDIAEQAMELTYYRYPHPLKAQPNDEDVLDNDVDTHYAIPYYVASFLVPDDNEYLSSMLYNKFEDKLGKLTNVISADITKVTDAYGYDQMFVYDV